MYMADGDGEFSLTLKKRKKERKKKTTLRYNRTIPNIKTSIYK